MRINTNFGKMEENYLFAEVERRTSAFLQANPTANILRLGIGDVTLPLCEAAVTAMAGAVEEMGKAETFRGYGPYRGYDFLLEAIRQDYRDKGVELDTEEIFINDGAKSDLGDILDLFQEGNVVLIPDPVYPAYVDANQIHGNHILYLDANRDNGFLPLPDQQVDADIIYLCSPNNPTGAVYTREQLEQWVAYALAKGAVIFFDAAYETFIQDENLPRSIFEIPEAKECAIEFCSFSKKAGFTGTRCGYTVIPQKLMSGEWSLNKLWLRRLTTKYNGVPYIMQRGAEAVFSPAGKKQTAEQVDYYLENTRLMGEGLAAQEIAYIGGEHSPYIWLACPGGLSSWDYFDHLLKNCQVIGTPGAGFGKNGEGFFRLTGFGRREDIQEAMKRIAAD